jgi:hypothetical protein
MSYTKTTDFLAKDSLPLNNAGKYVKGSEIDTEFDNIETADALNVKTTALGTGVETFLGTPSFTNLNSALTGDDAAGLATLQTFTKSQRGTLTTDNDGSFDMNVTNNFKCTTAGALALTFTNITSGQGGNILFINASNHAITAAATTKVTSSLLATISVTGTYLLGYFSDGTNVYVSGTGAMA